MRSEFVRFVAVAALTLTSTVAAALPPDARDAGPVRTWNWKRTTLRDFRTTLATWLQYSVLERGPLLPHVVDGRPAGTRQSFTFDGGVTLVRTSLQRVFPGLAEVHDGTPMGRRTHLQSLWVEANNPVGWPVLVPDMIDPVLVSRATPEAGARAILTFVQTSFSQSERGVLVEQVHDRVRIPHAWAGRWNVDEAGALLGGDLSAELERLLRSQASLWTPSAGRTR